MTDEHKAHSHTEPKAEEPKVDTQPEMPDNIIDKDGKELKSASTKSNNNTNAMLCWLVTGLILLPIPSIIWMNDKDEELKWHAKTTMVFAGVWFLGYIVWWLVYFLGSVLTLGCGALVCWIPLVLWLFAQPILGIIGAVKANNGERFEIPFIKDLVK